MERLEIRSSDIDFRKRKENPDFRFVFVWKQKERKCHVVDRKKCFSTIKMQKTGYFKKVHPKWVTTSGDWAMEMGTFVKCSIGKIGTQMDVERNVPEVLFWHKCS